MTPLASLGPDDLRAAVITFRDGLRAHQDRLNRLNVYPVPDGDTGTNMALTLESVVAALDGAASDMVSVRKAISHGSLMGARGNSGVIMSQVLRGLCEGFGSVEGVDGQEPQVGPAQLADAMAVAAKAAYSAVMRPVEGTILTVVRESADAAVAAAVESRALVEVLQAAAAEARDSVARTPDLLAVLAEAGVVDAGGSGYVLLLDALLHVVDGTPMPEAPASGAEGSIATSGHGSGHGGGSGHGTDIDGPRFEVMFLLEAPDTAIDGFKQAWAAIGDSIVVVGGDGLWNCHIHADDIGAAVEAGIDVGRPRRITVMDLVDQVHEQQWVNEHLPATDEAAPVEPVTTAVVAVASGTGAVDALRGLGVQEVVAGGQSMNPSTAELVAAVEATRAAGAVILPNNRNIVAVAMQVQSVTGRPVGVVPTRSVVEGAAALLAYDPGATAAENVEAMTEACAHLVVGQLTQAVRDSGDIAEGDWMGVVDGDVIIAEPDLLSTAGLLLDRLVEPGHELVTLIEGEGATPGATEAIVAWLAEHRPSVAVEVQRWDQPLCAYQFGIE